MLLPTLLTTALLASSALARSWQHVNKAEPASAHQRRHESSQFEKRGKGGKPSYGGPPSNGPIIPQNANTTKFKVDGKNIPFVDFNIGESYAGLLPISDKADVSELYFWFFPTDNADAGDEILIWLNGG